jgi:hypothetical protein
MSIRSTLLIALLLGAGQASATPSQALMADIHYEIRSITADGISKTLKYRDRFYRDPQQIWLERVMPAGSVAEQHQHEHEQEDEHHRLDLHDINFDIAARHVSKQADGKADIVFVSRSKELAVSVEPENYGTVGFNGAWASAFYLLDPNALADMPRLKRHAPSGSRWYGKDDATSYLRILWDQQRGFPLRIEAGRKDGSLSRTVVAQPRPLPPAAQLPWQQLGHYTHKDYNDLMD